VRWDGADGYHVVVDGVRCIDFSTGIFAAVLGHRFCEFSDRWGMHTYSYDTDIRDEYVVRLRDVTGYDGVLLFTTGSEAVEGALRLARLVMGRQLVFGLEGCFHGKTLGAQLVRPYGKRLKDVGNYAGNRAHSAGVIVEGYRGWDCRFWDEDVLDWLRGFQRLGKLLIVDEVQSGFGRTGRFFAYEHYGLTPDIVVVGKGMGNGFPVSGVLFRGDLIAGSGVSLEEFSSTHGGGPMACAAGLAVLDAFKRWDLVCESARKGALLHGRLAGIGFPVSGRGMVAAVFLESVEQADRVVDECARRGLLVVRTGKSTVKLGPALTMVDSMLMEGVGILEEVIRDEVATQTA